MPMASSRVDDDIEEAAGDASQPLDGEDRRDSQPFGIQRGLHHVNHGVDVIGRAVVEQNLGAVARADAARVAREVRVVDVGWNHVGRTAEYLGDSDYDPGLFPPIDLEHKFVAHNQIRLVAQHKLADDDGVLIVGQEPAPGNQRRINHDTLGRQGCHCQAGALAFIRTDGRGNRTGPDLDGVDAGHFLEYIFDLGRAIGLLEVYIDVELAVGDARLDEAGQREAHATDGHEQHTAQHQRDQRERQSCAAGGRCCAVKAATAVKYP